MLGSGRRNLVAPGALIASARSGGLGLFASVSFAAGEVVLSELPRLLATSKGSHNTLVWALVEEALKEEDAPCGGASLVGMMPEENAAPPNLCAAWLSWEPVDAAEAEALARSYSVTTDAVCAAYVGLARTNLFTSLGACGYYAALAHANHSCTANARTVDEGVGGLKHLVTTRNVAAGEELHICYTAWDAPAPAALRRAALLQMYGSRFRVASCALAPRASWGRTWMSWASCREQALSQDESRVSEAIHRAAAASICFFVGFFCT